MKQARLIIGFFVAALAVWLVAAVFREPGAPVVASGSFTSSQQCRECHAQEWSEWSTSWHGQAWTDPDVRALSNDFANTDCIDCHAPRGVFETGIGNRVLPRSARRVEGVDCIACHLLPADWPSGGLVAGTKDRNDVPCRPRASRELLAAEYCGVCHDQHKTVQQWRASKWPEKGVSCIDCHMPARTGEGARGHDHAMHGGHLLELVQRAVTLAAERRGGRVLVTVENVGAGHYFPTDERSRAGDLFWRPLAKAGETPGTWRWLYRFRSPYRHEVDLVDTLLPANDKKEVEIDDPQVSGTIEVALYYKLTPYWKDPAHPDPDGEARQVHRLVVEP
jgi:hypothetical protein